MCLSTYGHLNFVNRSVNKSNLLYKVERCLPIRPSVSLKLKISVTAKPIGLYSSENIANDPVVVLAIFLGSGTPPT